MLSDAQVREILKQDKPEVFWKAEPLLGSIYGEEEIEAAVAAIREAMNIHEGFGFSASPIPEFEDAFAKYVGADYAVALNSAGPGLDIAMRYLDLQPGDEVIVPSLNYQAAPLAVMGAGGQVIWGEVDPVTFQLDPEDVAKKITSRTRAVFPVHMNGLSAPMDELMEVCREADIPVIGDAARSCGGGYKDGKIGGFGLMTVFSFHTMKNMTTLGEGGMLTTNDKDVADFARSVRMYGSGVEKWGTSNVMTKVQAAVGIEQLKKLDGFIAARHRIAKNRDAMLDGLSEITLPFEPANCYHSYYLYTCLVKPEWAGEKRDKLMAMLGEDHNIGCVVANPPVYASRSLVAEHTAGQRTPKSEEIAKRIFCVSLHPAMSDQLNEYIAAAVIDCVARLR